MRSADAAVLSGGSVYGLAAADGVAAWLGAQGRGFALTRPAGVPPSPIVPAAPTLTLGTAGAGYGAGAGALAASVRRRW